MVAITQVTKQMLTLFCALVAMAGSVICSFAEPPTMLSTEEVNRLAELRAAGIQHDQSKIPALLEALQKNSVFYQLTALHALAQLGATEALPAIEDLAQSTHDEGLRAYALTARARLIAESKTGSGIRGKPSSVRVARGTVITQTDQKFADFLMAIGLTRDDLQEGKIVQAPHLGVELPTTSPSLKVQAVREIADIVYRDHYADYQTSPLLAGVDFSADAAALLKVQLAPLSSKQRVTKLIEMLAESKVYNFFSKKQVQLAIDEGLPASRAAAAKINDMDKHRDKYTKVEFQMLFDVLHGVGDKEQASKIKAFLQKPNSEFARGSYADVVAGRKFQASYDY